MSLNQILFILRLVSALLLLAFVGLMAWFIYKDMQITTIAISELEKPRGRLKVIETEAVALLAGTLLPLLPVTTIGRSIENTIILDDDYVSGEHALITLRLGRWWVEDLDSRNGTQLNEHQVEQATVLSIGDVLTIGRSRLRIEF